MKHNFAFIDVETTGSDSKYNRVMEIGIVRVENGVEVAKLDTLIDPKQSIPWFVRRMTGIGYKDVKGAPKFSKLADEIKVLLDGAIFVAHNASFDYSFIREEFKRNNGRFTSESLCTVKLSRALYPQFRKHSLGAIIKRFSIPTKDRHRAYADAYALWEFMQKAREDVGESAFNKSIDSLIGPATLLKPVTIRKNSFARKTHRFWFK